MSAIEGYKCDFVDSVPDYLYCKKCNLVARRLIIATCCGGGFCQTCITDLQEQGQHCPVCGEKEFTTFNQVKNQKKINGLQVNCSLKERGCVWSGTLDQLDTHLDPHLDNCQYVDTKCPRNCLKTIPKNKVDHHVGQECAKRPHVCKHCGFKATYEEVVDKHLPECKYVALQCPNMCGMSCEHEAMDDHMKICHLEEVECEFSSVGCDGRFIREDQDEHTRQNSQKHLTLTASLAVETKEQFQKKLLEQDKKHKEEEEKLKKMLTEKEQKLLEQEQKLFEHEKKMAQLEIKVMGKLQDQAVKQEAQLVELENKIRGKDDKIIELEQSQIKLALTLEEVVASFKQTDKRVRDIQNMTDLNRKFAVNNFVETGEWTSPTMYTHGRGYKFCVKVELKGSLMHGKYVNVNMWSMPGDFDNQLNWPANVKFTVEIINKQGGQNLSCTASCIWNRAVDQQELIGPLFPNTNIYYSNLLGGFLVNNTLYFNVIVH